jgi:hypothetical protein
MNHTSQLQIADRLTGLGIRVTPLGLEFPEELAIEAWAEVGRGLWRAGQVCQWRLGDWAAFGLRKYDEARGKNRADEPPPITLRDFAAANGIEYQTLRNLAWVSRAIPLSRRRDKLEWTKHAEVAALSASEQAKWLDKMEREDLPRSQVRQQIRLSQGESNALLKDGPVTKFVTKGLDDFTAWLRTRPEGFWDAEHRAIWREKLRPIVEFWGEL